MNFAGKPFGLKYHDGSDIIEGDIVGFMSDHDYLVAVMYWNRQSFSFKMAVTNRNFSIWGISDDPAREYYRLGSMYDSSDLLPLWKKAGELEHTYRFLKQGMPSTCFPLAAINACIGAGIEKASFNFDLYRRCVEVGECAKWGGCIDEQAVLNLIDAELGVVFTEVDLDSALETGGVVTIKDAAFHAVSAVRFNGCAFIVNMTGGPFIRPYITGCLARSDNPDHHRDYSMLVR
jgi:hypothetical protein